jgi:formate dehydrogenase major subunit
LGTSFGRGGATTFQQDLQNADCIVIEGSNMAECHPVGFQWVMEAKRRGATIIHVDPRFTRTSAVADIHVPIRAGSDIVFLGAIVRFIIENRREFRDYVVSYTNASAIVSDDFRDTEELDGLFSGWDSQKNQYDIASWAYRGAGPTPAASAREQLTGEPGSECAQQPKAKETDPTLEHPRCVFQILRRHYARYTPRMVEEACGIPPEQFLKVAEALCANSGRERTSAFCYAVGWTQHSVGVQYIRTAAIIQQLLGNMGRPGGGILALRGHASIQGSTDIPTLYNLLPGYLPMAKSNHDTDFQKYLANNRSCGGWWTEFPKYIVSLLKAWYGEHATRDNNWCFEYLPHLTGDHSHMTTYAAMADGVVKGYFMIGENPVVGSMNGGFQKSAMRKLEWMVVRDFTPTETAEFWKDAPEETPTEVFFFPAAAHTEKDGSFTNTQRLLQWHHKAIEPPGDCRSDLDFILDLGHRLRRLYRDSQDSKDRPIQQLTWDHPNAEAVLREVNGFEIATGAPVPGFNSLKDDGSTACGCWIYSGSYKDGVNQTTRRKPAEEQSWVAPEWGWAWPSNRRILYNRASADPQGRPWSERKKYVWWDEEKRIWTGFDVPDFIKDRPPSYRAAEHARGLDTISGDDPFIMNGDGKSCLFAPQGLQDGPLPTHYEPQESVMQNPLYGQQCNPARMEWLRPENPYHRSWNDPEYPYVATTYRLTEHHTAGAMSRWLSWLAELQPEMFCEISPEIAAERGLKTGDWARITTARAEIRARVLVTDRLKPLRMRGRTVHQIGLPYHWGSKGIVRGDSANFLISFVADPNVSIQESKAFTVNIEPVTQAHGLPGTRRPWAGATGRDLPVASHKRPGKHGVVTIRNMAGEET